MTFVWMVTMEILREVQESIRTTRRARNAPVMITLIPMLSEIVTRKLKVKVEIMLCTNKIKTLGREIKIAMILEKRGYYTVC